MGKGGKKGGKNVPGATNGTGTLCDVTVVGAVDCEDSLRPGCSAQAIMGANSRPSACSVDGESSSCPARLFVLGFPEDPPPCSSSDISRDIPLGVPANTLREQCDPKRRPLTCL